jgi:biotin synthase
VQRGGMSVCSGEIIGMGESADDPLGLLAVLSEFDPPPESIPINCLIAMPGSTPADAPPVEPGYPEGQALCFLPVQTQSFSVTNC